MIQIDFYSQDIISLLTPIYSLQPETLYLLIDSAEMATTDLAGIRETILSWGFVRRLHFQPVDCYRMKDILECLQQIAADSTEPIYIDLTGGWELFAAAGYHISQKNAITPVYMDLEKEVIYQIDTGAPLAKVRHIRAGDFISAIGAKRLEDSHYLPVKADYPATLAMAEAIFAHLPEWHALSAYLAERLKFLKNQHNDAIAEQIKQISIAIPPHIHYQGISYPTGFLVRQFVRHGFLTVKENRRYRFASAAAMQYLHTFGIWLELYIYIKAQSFFDEAALGVVIDWQKGDDLDTKDNEIDVLVMYHSSPVFISCKMRDVKAYDVYEVGYLANRLGGRQAKSIIATTSPIRAEGDNPTGIFKRLEKMKIGLLETGDFANFPVEEVFRQALAMTK